MKAHSEKVWKTAYLIGRDEIRRLGLVFSSINQTPRISVECAGGLTLKPASFDDLFEISNSGVSEISKITFSSDYRSDIDLTIVFSNDEDRPISLSVSGEHVEVVRIGSEVDQVVEHCKAWYGRTAAFRPLPFVALLFGAGMVALFFSFFTFFAIGTFKANHFRSIVGLLLAFGAISYERLMSYFFPVAIFEIGKGLGAPALYERRRSYAFGGMFLAIIGGIVVDIVMKHMER